MVARPEKKIGGLGEMALREAGQVDVSEEIRGESSEDVSGTARRPSAYVLGFEGWQRRRARIWEPWVVRVVQYIGGPNEISENIRQAQSRPPRPLS